MRSSQDQPSPGTIGADRSSADGDGSFHCSSDPGRQESQAQEAIDAGRIAIVGSSCRVPGAPTPEEFWGNLCSGVDASREVPADRWDVEHYWAPSPAPGKMYVRRGSFLDDIASFDADFFSITPREAIDLDPQHRLLLELVWEALERSNIDPSSLAGSRTGIFVGISNMDYALRHVYSGDPAKIGPYSATGIALSAAAGRVSYVLGLRGPCMSVDTACSSSLVAVDLACKSLRLRECDLAVAAAVNLIVSPEGSVYLSQVRALAADGRCKAFDASADGYGRGEGGVAVVLRRVEDAAANDNSIEAVILGSAVNHDGASNGFTAPSGPAQRELMTQALKQAGVDPSDVAYVEAHGTGTQLGDVIEAGALDAVYGADRPADAPLLIGSVKSNLGHLESAAGIVGLLKAMLAVKNGEIPAHLHFRDPSPRIPWDKLGVRVIAERTCWPHTGKRRIAGLSSFGLSGTNAHLILADARVYRDDQPAPPVKDGMAIFPLSARSETGLRRYAERFANYLRENPEAPLASVAAGAAAKARFHHRAAWVFRDITELRSELEAFAARRLSTGATHGAAHDNPKIAFVFSGQATQYEGMGRELYGGIAAFRDAVDECDAAFRTHVDIPVRELLCSAESSEVNRTVYLQPLLFTLQYGLSRLWRSWGIRPSVVLGHSVGEFAAVCVAGAVRLADIAPLVALRGRLIEQRCEPGAMISVSLGESQAAEAIKPYGGRVAVAATNGPNSTVLSGEVEALDEVAFALKAKGARIRSLDVTRAFHSALMDPARTEFIEAAAKVSWREPHVQIVSGLTGKVLSFAELSTAEYWWRQMREPVRMCDALRTVERADVRAMVEIGPRSSLLASHRETLPESTTLRVPSITGAGAERNRMLRSAAELFVCGATADFRAIHGAGCRPAEGLPTYPFERRRYWIEPAGTRRLSSDEAALPQPESIDASLEEFPSFTGTSTAEIACYLRGIISSLLLSPVEAIDCDRSIAEFGVDSLLLVLGLERIKHSLRVELTVRDVLERLQTINAIAEDIARQIEARRPETSALAAPIAVSTNGAAALVHAKPRPAFLCPRPVADARARIFCFPSAGASAGMYQAWRTQLPDWTELNLVQLPGRDSRSDEPVAQVGQELVEDLVAGLRPRLDKPFVLFGHSMGAAIAHLTAQRLEDEGKPALLLSIAGERAPLHPRPEIPRLWDLSDAELMAMLTELGILDDSAQRASVLAGYVDLLRADLALCGTLNAGVGSPLQCAIAAFAGRSDRYSPVATMMNWAQQTINTFSLRTLPGEHSFILKPGNPLPVLLAEEIDRELNRRGLGQGDLQYFPGNAMQ